MISLNGINSPKILAKTFRSFNFSEFYGKHKKILKVIFIILAVAVYMNAGWSIAYATYVPESLSPFLRRLIDPFMIMKNNSLAFSDTNFFYQIFVSALSPIIFVMEWILYIFWLICGGIAKLIILH